MPYTIRVLTPSEKVVAVADLSRCLERSVLTVESGTEANWDQLLLAREGAHEIAIIERNVVAPGSLAEGEIAEFVEELQDARPTSGAQWVRKYLSEVRTVYAFQVLGDTDDEGWDAIGHVKNRLWGRLGGIIQADGEGFSNEEGYHAVWQFSDRVRGPWWMGVLVNGEWAHFEMDLGNREQREEFLRGEVPAGVTLKGQKDA